MNQITIDIVIFAVIAVFLFFKLRSVLGEVDENDDTKTTSSPLSTKTKTSDLKKQKTNERLARLNPQNGFQEWPSTLPDFDLVTNATVHNALLQIHTKDKSFNPYDFLNGATRAFPMILNAFSHGDKDVLKKLLADDLYDDYVEIIDQRIKQGQSWDYQLIDLTKTLISKAVLDKDEMRLTVDFDAKEKVTARDKEGNFVGDQKGDLETTENRWVFAKSLHNKTHIWTLIDTQEIGEA